MKIKNYLLAHSPAHYINPKVQFFHFFILLMFATGIHAETIPKNPIDIPADVSFIIVDLKYNQDRGLQICEIQHGAVSAFKGHAMFYEGPDLIAQKLLDNLSIFKRSWTSLRAFADSKIKKLFSQDPRWSEIDNLSDLDTDYEFVAASSSPVINPSDIRAYHGLVFLSPLIKLDRDEFKKKYPGVLLTDNAFYNQADSKLKMTKLLLGHPLTRQHKPKCGFYNRNDHNLADRINNEIGSDILVIKPINEYRGKGVIILKKEELKGVLEFLFDRGNTNLQINDEAYAYWKYSRVKEFIVEEFIEVEPVFVPHLDNKPYCPTLRFAFLLSYSQNKIEIQTLGGYYTLPRVSLSEPGSLNERYKSYVNVPYFTKADPEIMKNAEVQMKEVLMVLYQTLLGIPNATD